MTKKAVSLNLSEEAVRDLDWLAGFLQVSRNDAARFGLGYLQVLRRVVVEVAPELSEKEIRERIDQLDPAEFEKVIRGATKKIMAKVLRQGKD